MHAGVCHQPAVGRGGGMGPTLLRQDRERSGVVGVRVGEHAPFMVAHEDDVKGVLSQLGSLEIRLHVGLAVQEVPYLDQPAGTPAASTAVDRPNCAKQ